jgi:hypothetical protein
VLTHLLTQSARYARYHVNLGIETPSALGSFLLLWHIMIELFQMLSQGSLKLTGGDLIAKLEPVCFFLGRMSF